MFSCDSTYGKDKEAYRNLCLIDDYWACRGKLPYKPFTNADIGHPQLFQGKLPQVYHLTDGKLISCVRETTDIIKGDWFKHATVYISPKMQVTNLKVVVKIRKLVTIKQMAMQTPGLQIVRGYIQDPRDSYNYDYFCKYKYLEYVLGESATSKHLAYFTFENSQYPASYQEVYRRITRNLPL